MPRQIRGIHVLAIIATFFLVTFSVNGIFIWRAVTTFPGEEVEKSYLQGIDYNATLARRAAQTELGWRAEIGVDPANQDQLLVRIEDRSGSPVGNLELSVRQRAYGLGQEDTFTLSSIQPGTYAAPLSSLEGRTQFIVEARRRDEEAVVFTAHKTIRPS